MSAAAPQLPLQAIARATGGGCASAAAERIDAAYPAWAAAEAARLAAERPAIRAFAAALPAQPHFVAVLPAEAEPAALIASLEALAAQLYPGWTARLVGRHAPPGWLAARLRAEPRLLWVEAAPLPQRLCIEMARAAGRHVMLLAPGERLAPHALVEIAAALQSAPEAVAVYADEDRLDAGGQRVRPWFKIGFDPDRCSAAAALGAAVFYYADALAHAPAQIAALATDTATPRGTGVSDRDFAALRDALAAAAVPQARPDRVVHVPAVLLHRPLADGDAAGRDAPIRPAAAPALPAPPPPVSVIVPVRDRAHLLARCADGVLQRTDYADLDLLIVDNDSREAETLTLLAALSQDRRVRVLAAPGPFNYAALNNRAVAMARGEVVVLLNNDIDPISPGWLAALVAQAIRPDVGAVGARLLYADGRLQHAGVALLAGGHTVHLERLAARDDPGYRGLAVAPRSVLAATAACLALRRAVFLEVGGFDARAFPVAFNDVDLCLRLREYGYRTVIEPAAELYHLESQSRGRAETPMARAFENRQVDALRARWGHMFGRDPYFNPNLACLWDEPLRLADVPPARPWHGLARHAG